MARALEPAVTPDDIVFELERFERSDDRLTLTGRWFGVRGRRFVRPTLTLQAETGRIRALADLADKPWPAEDGQPWSASFPWESDGQLEGTELSVAPDIAIQLPAPSSRRTRTQRLSAVPRREAMTASGGDWPAAVQEEPAAPTDREPPPGSNVAVAEREPDEALSSVTDPPEVSEPQPGAEDVESLLMQLAEASNAAATSSAELRSLKSELASVQAELSAVRTELAQARGQLDLRGSESETVHSELSAARAAREAALRSAAQAEAERESALTRAAQAEAERDSLAAESSTLAVDLERARAELGRLGRERDQAMTSRGAALVMRGATQALPAYERHVGWLRRGLALLLLVGAVLAALIVLHVL